MLLFDDGLSVLADLCVWAARAGRALVSVTRRGRSRLRRWAGMSSWCVVFPSTRMIDGRYLAASMLRWSIVRQATHSISRCLAVEGQTGRPR